MAVNAITALMGRVRRSINRTVLDLAFKPEFYKQTVDQRIIDEVISKIIRPAVNSVAGKKAAIPIRINMEVKTLDPPVMFSGLSRMSAVYRVPPHARENMDIGSIINMSYFGDYSAVYPNASAGFFSRGNNGANMASFALNSRTYGDANMPPRAILLAGNMIRCTPPIYTDGTILNCLLEYDDEFTNLNGGAVEHFVNLAICAIKSWIYQEMIVRIDMGALSAGQTVGAIKDIVLSYAEEENRFDELMLKFRGAMMFDPDTLPMLIANAVSA